MSIKSDTECKFCGNEFSRGQLVAAEKGWSCPYCGSYNFGPIKKKSGKALKYDETIVKYEEGPHD